MGVEKPSAVIVDNCCLVRKFVLQGIGKDTAVLLDVYHFMMRYSAAIFNGAKNPHRREVLVDVRNAIIKKPAKPNQPAEYWPQSEQERRIIEMYDKWVSHGDVWSGAAPNVHRDQLKHVRTGCLARPREDIAMDGSRIEGSHKGWNSLQRAQSSGIEVYTALAHDYFLRRNMRIGFSRIENKRPINASEFVASTYASHHVQLVNHTAERFNCLYEKEPETSKNALRLLPMLPQTQVDETIGLIKSENSLSYGGNIKIEDDEILVEEINAQLEETDPTALKEIFQDHSNNDSSTAPADSAEAQASLPATDGNVSLDNLRRPLAIPASLRNKGLTRSQLIFSIGTAIDPRALQIDGKDEFLLYMDMRAEFQWTSFGMTASKWASATQIFNDRLLQERKDDKTPFIKKNPRALADKLRKVESMVLDRV
ncbi:hypothetical protein BDN70DRAFT_821684, partial [Pholiota conissans]